MPFTTRHHFLPPFFPISQSIKTLKPSHKSPLLLLSNPLHLLNLKLPPFSMDSPLIVHELLKLETPSLINDLLYSSAPTSFWTWTLLLLALASTALAFLLSKLHLSIFQTTKTPPFYYSCSDDDDASVSSSNDSEEEESEVEEEEKEEKSELFSSNFSLSLPDFVGGIGIVKAWDELGLGFNQGAINFLDVSRGDVVRSFNGGAAESRVVGLASRTEIVSASSEVGGAVVRVWDAREGNGAPAGCARPELRRRVAGVVAREGKVFVGDEGGEVAAVDLRKMGEVSCGEGFGCWWRSAARCLTLLSPQVEGGK